MCFVVSRDGAMTKVFNETNQIRRVQHKPDRFVQMSRENAHLMAPRWTRDPSETDQLSDHVKYMTPQDASLALHGDVINRSRQNQQDQSFKISTINCQTTVRKHPKDSGIT
jgi:hypothetical protein